MIHERLNGDLYLGNTRVYNGLKQQPVGWVRLLLGIAATALFVAFLTIWLSV